MILYPGALSPLPKRPSVNPLHSDPPQAGSTAPNAHQASPDAGAPPHLYREMLRIRRFEERLEELVKTGKIGGTTHLSAGQEAVAVGVSMHLAPTDLVVSTHRGHGHLLAKGARADRAMAEFAGRRDGYCMGKGGSQHTAVPEIGHMGSNGITGGGLGIGNGLALAQKLRGTGAVVVAYLGDGAAATGAFHESLNLAAIWKLPIVFVLENNLYAMSTPVDRFAAAESFADWASRYRGMEAACTDGNDVFAVGAAAEKLLARARSGDGPALLQCDTYRTFGHSKSDARVYRTRDEEAAWKARDPLTLLAEAAQLSESELEPIHAEVEAEIDAAVEFALASPPGDEALALAHMDAPEPEPAHPTTPATPKQTRAIPPGTETTFTEAIRDTLRGELARDERVLLLGEDIGAYGGAFGVTRGLLDAFGAERIRETPISENGFTSLAVGAAVGGMRPVVELMFGDFVTCAMDALVNHAAKLRYMYAGQVRVPFTLRMPIGKRGGYGATHSQSLEGWFLHVPGMRVVCPATVEDAVGLLRTAIRTDAPVLFLEPKLLYPARGTMPTEDHVVPLGRARIDRPGRDLSIFTYGQALRTARQAAEILAVRGVEAEIVDLRSLAPLDLDTTLASIRRTGRGLVVHEASEQGGVADALIGALLPRAFGHLHAPIEKACARPLPIPSAPALEDHVFPSVHRVVEAALSLMEY